MEHLFETETLLYIGAIILLLFASGFFSAAETALTAVSRARIYQMVMDGNKRARLVSKLRKDKEALIGTVLLGNNAINIAASTIATSLTIRLFGSEDSGLVIVTIIMTFMVVVFSEILPKTYAIQNAERVSLAFAPIVAIMVRLVYPITKSIQIFIRALLKLFGIDITKSNTMISSTDAIRGTIELHHQEGEMIKQDRDMLGSILDLNDITVGDIMVHRKEVETVNADLAPLALMDAAVRTLHSRIPLYKGESDNIVGLLQVKTLIKEFNQTNGKLDNNFTVDRVCAKPWFVPETTNLRDQLLAFRAKRQHFAFVIDEYGAWRGIVTLEDIIEEIVGDIEDEHDVADHDVQKVNDTTYFVKGDVTIRDLNRQLDWNLPDDHASTLAGLLMHEAERVPNKGEQFEFHDIRFTVMDKNATQLTRIKIEKLGGDAEDDMGL